jgi:hypothetical protein
MLKGSTAHVIFVALSLISICYGQSCEYTVDSDGDDSYICLDYCGTGTAFGYTDVEATGDIVCAIICVPDDDADAGECTSDLSTVKYRPNSSVQNIVALIQILVQTILDVAIKETETQYVCWMFNLHCKFRWN